MTETPEKREPERRENRMDAGRRAALARLGFAAVVAYSAPVVTRLDQAKAAVPSHKCRPSGKKSCP